MDALFLNKLLFFFPNGYMHVANSLNNSVAGESSGMLLSNFANRKIVSSDSKAIQKEWYYESCTWAL